MGIDVKKESPEKAKDYESDEYCLPGCPEKYPWQKSLQEKASEKIAPPPSPPRKFASQENCLPEDCFTRFLLLLTLSYGCSF